MPGSSWCPSPARKCSTCHAKTRVCACPLTNGAGRQRKQGLHKRIEANSTGGAYVIGGMPAVPEVAGDSIRKAQMEALRKSAIALYRKRKGPTALSLHTPIGKASKMNHS